MTKTNKTNEVEIIDHGVMLQDYFCGTAGAMLSIPVDNTSTYGSIMNDIDNEIVDIYDHIIYTAKSHNFIGNNAMLEKSIQKEVQKIKDQTKDKLDQIAFPDLDFSFDNQDQSDILEQDFMEYPVLIFSIEFGYDEFMPDYRCNVNNARKTGASLQYAFDYPEKFYGMQEYIDGSIETQIEIRIDSIWQDFSIFDYYNIPILEQAENGDIFCSNLLDEESDMELDYYEGYYLSYSPGDKNLDTGLIFVGTFPGIGEEIEDQADNGNCAYYYIGNNYFEIWVHERFVDWTKIEEK